MILLRASGTDDNPAGASEFCSVPQPLGVIDGDLLLVAIAVDAADITITPPDDSWSRVYRTDPTQGVSLAVYQKIALNEGPRWVFALSASADTQGVVAVYGGADGWEPVEAARAAFTASSTSQAIPAAATSLPDEELALFLAADAASTYTPASGYAAAQAKQNGGTIAVHRKPLAAPGPVAATSATFGSAADGVSVLVVLRPSLSDYSVDDAQQLLIDALPADVERVYDLEPGGDYYKFFRVMATVVKDVVLDAVEIARVEIMPRFARYVLPDWERVFGHTTSRTARSGTIPQRQAQVTASWREAAGLGSTRDAATAILGRLLGYDESTDVEPILADRGLLQIAHSYESDLLTANDGGSREFAFTTIDGGKVSTGGVRVFIEYAVDIQGPIDVLLTSPNGVSKTWTVTLDGQSIDWFWGAEFAGELMSGIWSLELFNNTGDGDPLDFIATVFVEGVTRGRNDGQLTGAAVFDWGLYADPAHMGESGTPADLDAARRAIKRMEFAHTTANLIQSKTPLPDVDVGASSAIPDECIPT